MKPIVINLFGAPGAGKSTGAAYIFAKLKLAGINAELVQEFAKDKVYEESKAVFENQQYIFGKQSFRMSRLANQVDVIVTDSPLPLSVFYNKNPILGEYFNKLVISVFHSYNNLSYFLVRDKPYNPSGRFQTEKESDALVNPMIELLNQNGIYPGRFQGNEDSYDLIIKQILEYIEKEQSNG